MGAPGSEGLALSPVCSRPQDGACVQLTAKPCGTEARPGCGAGAAGSSAGVPLRCAVGGGRATFVRPLQRPPRLRLVFYGVAARGSPGLCGRAGCASPLRLLGPGVEGGVGGGERGEQRAARERLAEAWRASRVLTARRRRQLGAREPDTRSRRPEKPEPRGRPGCPRGRCSLPRASGAAVLRPVHSFMIVAHAQYATWWFS